MKIKRNYIYAFLLSLVFIAAGFFGGYFSSRMIYEKKINTQITENDSKEIQSFHSEPVESTPGTTSGITVKPYYLLVGEETSLRLYEVSGSSKVLIKSMKFSPEFVPAEDRRKLESGIRLDTKEDGFSLIEDFTS